MDLTCETCQKSARNPVRLPCCQRLHCRRCAWRGMYQNAKYCWYPSCKGKKKLSYNLPEICSETPEKENDSHSVANKAKASNNDADLQHKFTCHICDNSYKSLPAYKGHILTHYNIQFSSILSKCSPFECPKCKVCHKNWHRLILHYAFKEDQFFFVTKNEPKDFPLLVRKYERRTAQNKEKTEKSSMGKSLLKNGNLPSKKRNKDAKKVKKRSAAKEKCVRKRFKAAQRTIPCRVKALEPLKVLLKRQEELKTTKEIFNSKSEEIISSVPREKETDFSTCQGDGDNLSNEECQTKDIPSGESQGNQTCTTELVTSAPSIASDSREEESLGSQELSSENQKNTGAEFSNVNNSTAASQVTEASPAPNSRGLEIASEVEIRALLKSEKSDDNQQTYTGEYFEEQDPPLLDVKKKEEPDTLIKKEELDALIKKEEPDTLTKKEEPDDLIMKDEADSVLLSQTEPDPRSVLTAAPDEEILIPQCPMCVCDHSLALCFQCQSFQLTVLATSDRFLLAEVTSELQNKNGVTKANVIKLPTNTFLKETSPSSRIPYPQISEVFNRNLILLSVESSPTASKNLEKGTIAGICQTWLGFKEKDVRTAVFRCENVRIEDDGSLLLTCSTELQSRLLLLKVENLSPHLRLGDRYTSCDLKGYFKIRCFKATIEYLPTPGEVLGSVTTSIQDSSREEIKNSLLLPPTNMLSILQAVKPKKRKKIMKFNFKRTAKARENVADIFQHASDTESDGEMEATKELTRSPADAQSLQIKRPETLKTQKSQLGREKQPQKIPTIIGGAISKSKESPTTSLPKPVPASGSCKECIFTSAEVRTKAMTRCLQCPIFELKVKEDTTLLHDIPKSVPFYLKTKGKMAGYETFARVFTNRDDVLLIPDRLDSHYDSKIIPRLCHNNEFFVNSLNSNPYPIVLKKSQIVGKGYQLMFIKN